MVSRDRALDVEARDLWRTIRQDSPPPHLTGSEILALLVASGPVPTYDRLASPFLRPAQIVRPSPSAT